MLADLGTLGILYIVPSGDRCESGEAEPGWPLLSVEKGALILLAYCLYIQDIPSVVFR